MALLYLRISMTSVLTQNTSASLYSYPGLFFRTSWSHLLAKGLICPGAEVSVNFVKNKYSPSGDILENLPPG